MWIVFPWFFCFNFLIFTVRLENFFSFCASHSQFGTSREKNFVFLPRWAKLTVLSTKTKNSPGSLSKSIIFNRKIMEKRSTSKRNDDNFFSRRKNTLSRDKHWRKDHFYATTQFLRCVEINSLSAESKQNPQYWAEKLAIYFVARKLHFNCKKTIPTAKKNKFEQFFQLSGTWKTSQISFLGSFDSFSQQLNKVF